MRVILYSTVDDITDPKNRFHARVLSAEYAPETAKGRDGFALVYFRGATAEEATEKAEAYIQQRTASAANRVRPRGKKVVLVATHGYSPTTGETITIEPPEPEFEEEAI